MKITDGSSLTLRRHIDIMIQIKINGSWCQCHLRDRFTQELSIIFIFHILLEKQSRFELTFLGCIWALGPNIWTTKLCLNWYWLKSMNNYEYSCKNSELIFCKFQWYFSRVFKFSNFLRTKRTKHDSIPLDDYF